MDQRLRLKEFFDNKQVRVIPAQNAYSNVVGKIMDLILPEGGLIPLNPKDLLVFFRRSERLALISAEEKGEDAARKLGEKIEQIIKNERLTDCRRIAFNVTGNNSITLFEIKEAAQYIYRSLGHDFNIPLGVHIDDQMKGIRASVLMADR